MATDLEFRQTQLPAIRLRPIKIRSNLKPLSSNNNIHNINNNNNKDLLLHQGRGGGIGIGIGCQSGGDDYYDDDDDDNNNQEEEEEEEEEEVESAVVTPTSAESKIPTALSCPPAPIKPRRVLLCKRKLSDELQFFEITSNGRDQVESFFRSSYESSSSSSNIISRRFKKTKTESIE